MIIQLISRSLILLLLLYHPLITVHANNDGFVSYGDDGMVTYNDDGSLSHNKQTFIIKKVTKKPTVEKEKPPVCQFASAQYRKKIAAVYFPIENPQHVDVVDYYDFDKGIGKELLRRLALSGDYLVKPAEHINLYPEINAAPYIKEKEVLTGHSALASIERTLAVQYVISGVVRDLSTQTGNGLKLPFNLSLKRNQLVALNKQPEKPEKRHLVIDFYLHDALTEELIHHQHYSEYIDKTEVKPNHSVAFGTREFFDSDYGKLFDNVLQQETDAIKKVLACRPYAMKIVDQDKKDPKDRRNIYLNAGQNTGIKAGDILTMQHADRTGVSFTSHSQRKQFGTPKSTVKITKVFPSYSVATSANEEVVHLERNTDYLLFW